MGLFGKDSSRDPKDQVREWSRKLRQEMRVLERQIYGIQREEVKVVKQIKDAAKKGDKDVCRILAKEVVRSRKATTKIYTSKAQINSVIMNINNQVSVVRLSGCLQKSAEVMKSMQNLVRVADIAQTMRELSKEMMKAGIIEEMLEDTLDSTNEENLEEESEEEVEKILNEIVKDDLVRAPKLPKGEIERPSTSRQATAREEKLEELPEESMEQMQERLKALRS
uniref:Charged multivesicular body protein 3 n=1 Tax=Romanomermis culicivorax TaxID=13658 RepID=A0A915K4Y7_ROMCU